jgi:serine/threonine protein kinase
MIDQTISHYKILELLGDAPPGAIYRAEETETSAPTMLRLLPGELGSEERKRMIRLATAVSNLGHPNLDSLRDIGETEDGRVFTCATMLEGDTLQTFIEKGTFKTCDAVEVALRMARGLKRTHRAGIVHGALRPEHVRIAGPPGAPREVRVLGFGLVMVAGEGLVVRFGDPLRGLAYRSPEQIRGGKLHPRIDVWSLGVILYEMLTGYLPFEGNTTGALAEAILGRKPSPLNPETPASLTRLLNRALGKEVDQRYSDIGDLGRELQAVAQQLDEKPGILASKSTRRRKRATAATKKTKTTTKATTPRKKLGKATSKAEGAEEQLPTATPDEVEVESQDATDASATDALEAPTTTVGTSETSVSETATSADAGSAAEAEAGEEKTGIPAAGDGSQSIESVTESPDEMTSGSRWIPALFAVVAVVLLLLLLWWFMGGS